MDMSWSRRELLFSFSDPATVIMILFNLPAINANARD